jgi:hypothetical protein
MPMLGHDAGVGGMIILSSNAEEPHVIGQPLLGQRRASVPFIVSVPDFARVERS